MFINHFWIDKVEYLSHGLLWFTLILYLYVFNDPVVRINIIAKFNHISGREYYRAYI